jgi:hypothetical protein
MQPKQPRTKRTHLVVGYISIFALFALIASLGGCNKTPVDHTERGPASASPKPTGTPESGKADTPIVVKGGGSIDLDFDDNAYSNTPNPVCMGCRITKVELEQIRETGQPIPQNPVITQCPFQSAPTVAIETAGHQADISVNSINGGVQIAFIDAQYPGVITECGDAKKHHSRTGVIQDVKVNNVSCEGCRGNPHRCRVVIHVF